MQCSISTSNKSGSNWLDRLRSAKGFPAADQLDLEQFLTRNPHSLSSSTDAILPDPTPIQFDPDSSSNSAPSDKTPVIDDTNGETEWFGVMTNVLSDLFYMGDTNHFFRKSCRKQPNPKICNLSLTQTVNDARDEDVAVSGALPSSSQKIKEMSNRLQLGGVNVEPLDVEEEEERSNADLSTFSRTEVTVIDTSYPSWKFDKMLFRRKNVWKVRDRKSKSIIANMRKRKANLVNESGYAGEEKKQCSSYKFASGKACLAPSHQEHSHINKTEEACKQKPDVLARVQENRLPAKQKNRASSVVLIKSIPTTNSKKNEASILKSCTKAIQKLNKA